MAGSSFFSLASQFSASASRLQANINSVIEKYDRHFENDDLISLHSMCIDKHSSRGSLRKIKDTHKLGLSHLHSTKRKDELLKLRLGIKENKVDLNVSRAIQRECAVALADLDGATTVGEPSDAETLPSIDDSFESDAQVGSPEEEEIVPTSHSNSDTNSSVDEQLSEEDEQVFEDSYSEKDNCDYLEGNHNSPYSSTNTSTLNESKTQVLKNSTVVIVISDNSDDDGDNKFIHNFSMGNGQTTSPNGSLNCTYIVKSPSTKNSKAQRSVEKKCDSDTATLKQHDVTVTDTSFVSISSPRPKEIKARNRIQPDVNATPSPLISTKDIPKRSSALATLHSNRLHSGAHQSCVTSPDNGQAMSSQRVIKYDGVFKSPQAIRPRRIAPALIGPVSNSKRVKPFPKQQSNSSGISSCSSLGHGEHGANPEPENTQSHTKHHNFLVGNGVIKPLAQSNTQNFPPSFDSPSRTVTNKVDQWLDMVNMNSTMSKEPLHYPSCPPKILKEFCQQASQTILQKEPMPHSPSSNKLIDVGIQTTLNSTVRCSTSKRNSPPRRIMKDVSTILSNSFLDAHSPRRLPTSIENPKREHRCQESVTNGDKIMFPEDFVYKFCPLNPNRIDSDDSANVHQNICLREGLKCFRPRRNKKRALEEELPNGLSSSRHSKIVKLDKTESFSSRASEHSYSSQNYFQTWDDNGTFTVQTPRYYKSSAFFNYSPGSRSRPGDVLNVSHEYMLKENRVRAAAPICVTGKRSSESNSCNVVVSSNSETTVGTDFCNHRKSLVSPHLDAFLDSSSNKSVSPLKGKPSNRQHSSFLSSKLSPAKAGNRQRFSSIRDKYINHLLTTPPSRNGQHAFGTDTHSRIRNTGRKSELRCKSQKDRSYSTMGHLTFECEIQTELDRSVEVEESGSFLDAHTPKAKVLQSSPQKMVLHNQSVLKSSETNNWEVSQSSSNFSPSNCSFSLQTESFNREALFNGPAPNILPLRHQHSIVSGLCKNRQRKGPDGVSNALGGQEQYKTSDIGIADRADTEEYSLNMSIRTTSNSKPDAPFTASKRSTLDDTLSTIYGSDEDQVDGDWDLRGTLRHSSTLICENSHKPMRSHFSPNLPQHHGGDERNGFSRNARKGSKQYLQHTHPAQVMQKQRQNGRACASVRRDHTVEDNCGYVLERRHRASTPLRARQSAAMSALPLDFSMSTIISLQDEGSDDDSYDEDWDTKLIEDVDIL